MGKPMAMNLLKAGFTVVAHNRSRPALEAVVTAGARAASAPADVAKQTTVIITMLPDTADVEHVLTAPDGVLAGLRRGSLVVDMSSISPVATERLARLVSDHGGSMLDAPVSGGEIGAVSGTLSIMVGGEAAAFDRARPILEAVGNREKIVHIGKSGAGQVCKVCNQIAIGGALAGVSEAFALARKAGVDAGRVRSALLGGFAASRVLEVHGERMLTGNYKPGFRTKLYQKDLRLAGEAAAAHSVALPGTAIVTQLVNALVAKGGADLDYAAVATVLFGMAGLS
jgi:2-hydroxy-3-oxopropionate reductase